MWRELVAVPDGGLLVPRPWWQTQTPLAADCALAMEKFHRPVHEYYRTTPWKIRLLHRLALAYRQQQEEAAEDATRQLHRDQEESRAALAATRSGGTLH